MRENGQAYLCDPYPGTVPITGHHILDGPKVDRSAMAIMITDECINCGACEPECPNNAIYEGGAEWRLADGTSLRGTLTTPMGNTYDADAANTPKTMDV